MHRHGEPPLTRDPSRGTVRGEESARGLVFEEPRRVRIPLKVTVRHAAASRATTDSVVVVARRGAHVGLGEGCPRPYVTGETSEGALTWLAATLPVLARSVPDIERLRDWCADRVDELDRNPSAWAAAEIACLDLLARERGCSVEGLLGLPDEPARFRYSAVLALEEGDALRAIAGRYLKLGLTDIKLRPTGDAGVDRVRLRTLRELASSTGVPSIRIRMDGNNLWAGRALDCARYLSDLGEELHALEEPLSSGAYDELAALSRDFDLAIVLDEGARTPADIARAADAGGRWIVNLKVAKAGGILRSLAMVDEVRARGWPLVLGAHVGETSILTRAALVVARAAGATLFAQEGAFGTHLLEHDLVRPSLSFGPGGVLRWPDGNAPAGLGLELAA